MKKYPDLHVYRAANRLRNWHLAQSLNVSAFRLSGLLYPERYPVKLDDDLIARVAGLLNQPVSYVRRLYSRAA